MSDNLNLLQYQWNKQYPLEDLVIYNKDGIIALQKPAGLTSQGSKKDRPSIAKLRHQLNHLSDTGKIFLLHRTDKHTTGVILLATEKELATKMYELFQTHNIQKEYWALLDGEVRYQSGKIKHKLSFNGTSSFRDEVNGMEAITVYKRIAAHNGASFVSMRPRTGRPHQIRFHARSYLKSPLIGDYIYNPDYDPKINNRLEYSPDTLKPWFSQAALSHQIYNEKYLLHARAISFDHPITGEKVIIESDLPPERKEIWRELGFNPNIQLKRSP